MTGREPGTVGRDSVTPKRRRRRRSRLLIPLVVIVVMGFLYYRPISTYRETRNERAARVEQVVALRAEKLRLERRLARATSAAALARDARRIGYVRPGERLFIVKGIESWRRTHRAPAPRAIATVSPVDERDLVERQIGRRPRAFHRVAARCPFGMPAVTEQEPYDTTGSPFPTTYYLTCRHAIAAVSRLEAAGGVERWSATVAASPALQLDLDRATARQREIRHALAGSNSGTDHGASLDTGIGGSRNPARLKCLHAHVAFALAQPGYRLGEAILAEVAEPWPADACCFPDDERMA